MLTVLPKSARPGGSPAVWFDLQSPTDDEIREVERRTGASLPRRDALSEIERSSRLQQRDGVLTMSTPTIAHGSGDGAPAAPLGIVLSKDWLVTIRFTPLATFDAVLTKLESADQSGIGAQSAFAELCEAIVDHLADGLENLAGELGKLSMATFQDDDGQAKHAVQSNRALRVQLRQIGRSATACLRCGTACWV